MADALRALVDAVGLQVAYCAELEADPGSAWTHHFADARPGHLWVATQSDQIWVGRGEDEEMLERGKAALLAPGASAWVGTDPAGNPPPRVSDPDAGFGLPFQMTGVHHGIATFGPLMPEALALPDFSTTAGHPFADTDVAVTLQHIVEQGAERWPGPRRDALARVLVVALVAAWRPPVLRDNSLTRCIDAIAEPGPPPTVPDLAALARTSQSTLLRRFGAVTGLTPGAFIRWFRTLPVRSTLAVGTDESTVARDFGYPSPKALRRAIARVAATVGQLPGPEADPWIRR